MKSSKARAERVGARGHAVYITTRSRSPNLYLRWWGSGNWVWRSLGHADWDRARAEARSAAAALLVGEPGTGSSGEDRPVMLAELFALYEDEVTPGKGPQAQAGDRAMMDTWQAFLGDSFLVMSLRRKHLDDFQVARREGRIQIPGRARKLRAGVRIRTIQADLDFLRSVLRWASGMGAADPILPKNPMEGYPIPREPAPTRRVADANRFEQVMRELERSPGHLGLAPAYFGLLEALGWRTSAICRLRAADIRMAADEKAPHGRIRKSRESDKEGIERWVPMSTRVRHWVDRVMELRPVVGEAWLFPSRSRPGEPWSRHYVYGLHRRAQIRAGFTEFVGLHAYRRKWATERKHHPRGDVAAAGDWRSTAMVDIYTRADDETTLAVMENENGPAERQDRSTNRSTGTGESR